MKELRVIFKGQSGGGLFLWIFERTTIPSIDNTEITQEIISRPHQSVTQVVIHWESFDGVFFFEDWGLTIEEDRMLTGDMDVGAVEELAEGFLLKIVNSDAVIFSSLRR